MNEELLKKSIHDLRAMAQAFGVTEIFEKAPEILRQEIEIKQQTIFKPAQVQLPPRPEYDARLMSAPPSTRASADEIVTLLEPHIKLGLKLTFDEENWYMHCGIKRDTGTIRMPLVHVLACAEKVLTR